jgi:HSP20 family molecular chaperone IbpA
MLSQNEIATKKNNGGNLTRQGQQAYYLRPTVDIVENSDTIKMIADLPGVSDKTLKLEVDADTLIIEGDIDINMPDNLDSLYSDIRASHYKRAFSLSSELNTDKIDATLKDGLLSITIPKREEVKPRKIAIKRG